MPFVISNPWGLLALLGIPAVLLIHFLQRRAKVVPCSTLFLLEQTQKESVSGRKFDKLIHSVPLWMQLVLVLLATLLIIQPRYINTQATQRIAIVMDSSASMSVFKEKARQKVLEQVPILQGLAPNLELWLLDSDISRDRVYHGASIEDLTQALENWVPNSGTSSPHHALRIGRSLAGHEGALVYITDTPSKSIPYNATVHAIGEKRSNAGFTGVSFENKEGQVIWQASIKNYSTQRVQRTWWMETDQNAKTEARNIILEPGELSVVSGPFPSQSERIMVKLSPDDFIFDDELPLISPLAKELEVSNQCSEKLAPLADKIIANFENLAAQANPEIADLLILSVTAETEKFGLLPAIVFLEGSEEKEYIPEAVVATDQSLTNGLNWNKLLVTKGAKLKLGKRDTPLVWAGETPIIFQREVPLGLGDFHRQLVFNFDFNKSNAAQQECIALLLFRFLAEQRQSKKTLLKTITELSQPLDLNIDKEGKKTTVEVINLAGEITSQEEFDAKHPLRAMENVGFYSVRQGDDYLLHASNYYADTREADLSACDEGVLESSQNTAAIDKQTDEDNLWRLWLMLILASLLISWNYGKDPQSA